MFSQEGLDLSGFAIAEAKLRSYNHLFDLGWTARSDNRASNSRISQGPGYGNDTSWDVVRITDFAQKICQFQITGQARLMKLCVLLAPIVSRHMLDAFFGHIPT